MSGKKILTAGDAYELGREFGLKLGREQSVASLKNLVDTQAEDEGLWADAENVVEAYLQQELRKLHAAIEELEN